MRLTQLIITFERPARADERRNIVRKEAPYGPLHKRHVTIEVDIPVGPESHANTVVKAEVVKALRRHRRPEDELFYVVGAFRQKHGRKTAFYRTIVARHQLGGSGL